MYDYNNSDEINRLKTLNVMYSEENERIKLEYKSLYDRYEEKNKELELIRCELEKFKYEYDVLFGKLNEKDEEISRYKKMRYIKIRSSIGRFLRKIKCSFTKKGWV